MSRMFGGSSSSSSSGSATSRGTRGRHRSGRSSGSRGKSIANLYYISHRKVRSRVLGMIQPRGRNRLDDD